MRRAAALPQGAAGLLDRTPAGQQLLATALPQGAAVAPRPGSADACTTSAAPSSMRRQKHLLIFI